MFVNYLSQLLKVLNKDSFELDYVYNFGFSSDLICFPEQQPLNVPLPS